MDVRYLTREEIGLGGERNQQLVGGDDPEYEFTFSDFDSGFEARFAPPIPGGQAEEIPSHVPLRIGVSDGNLLDGNFVAEIAR